MKPVPSADGAKVNWLNYKTGEKNIEFKMNADNKTAFVAIEISHVDIGLQQLYFEQFVQLKKVFEEIVNEEWMWAMHAKDENGKTISRIFIETVGVSIFKKADWPALISFFKPRIISLDTFWNYARYSFEILG